MVNFRARTAASAAIVEPEAPEITVDGDALASHAFDLGSKVGEATENAFLAMVKGKEDWEGGPFRVMFGIQNDLTDEQIAELAKPGSTEGNNPDEYKVTKEDGKGKLKLVASDFWKDFARGTPASQAMLSRIEMCERAGDMKAIKDDIPADIIELAKDAHRLEQHVAFLSSRVRNMPKAYRKGAELLFQFDAVNSYPGVQAEPVWAQGKSPSLISEGELPDIENTTLTVMVWITPEEGKPVMRSKQMTKSEFLRLNPARAIEKGGTFNALLETAVNKKGSGGNGQGSNSNETDGLVIKTIEKGISVLAELHRWFTEIGEQKSKEDIGKLYKLMNTKDNDELVVTAFELRDYLNRLCEDTGAGQKYLKLQQGGSDLTAKAADAGTKAAA